MKNFGSLLVHGRNQSLVESFNNTIRNYAPKGGNFTQMYEARIFAAILHRNGPGFVIALFRDLNLHLTRNHLVHVDKQIEQRGYQQVYWKTYNRPLRSRAKALVALRAAKEKHSYKRAERPTSSGCKGNCLSNRCSCRKGGKKCGGVCRCLKCENQ